MDLSKLPAALQYTIEKSPEPSPRDFQTDVDSSLPVKTDDPIIANIKDIPLSEDEAQTLDNKLCDSLPDIGRPDLVPDDIFDRIQKKLVREKKKLNGRKPAPVMRKVKKHESDHVPPPEPEEDEEELIQIKKAYVKFQEEPQKIRRPKSPPVQTYPPGTKLTKAGRPRKQLSDEAKENRRKALEKGRETRRRNALAKKEASITHVNKKPSSPVNIPEPKVRAWTQEDLAQSQFDAIDRYEQLRKERKQKKKEARAIEEQRQQIKKVVQREVNWQAHAGRFANCY